MGGVGALCGQRWGAASLIPGLCLVSRDWLKQCTLLGTILDIKYQVVSVVFMGFIKTKASTEGSLCPGGWKRLERRAEG